MSLAGEEATRRLLDDPAVGRLLALLNTAGEEARIVGGAVRDALLGVEVKEIDLATTASPEEVIRRAAAAGLRTVPTGMDHGTVTILLDGRGFEVTTLRTDVEADGRRAKVRFGRDWAADAARRDFTVNALSLGPDGRVHDFCGGLADLQARRIRFIGEPRARIREDFLRILRFFRFHAAYGVGLPDREGLEAVVAERAGLAGLSPERVRQEMIKLLAASGAAGVTEVMADCGILQEVLGGVPRTARLQRLTGIEAALGRPPDAMLRLAALAVFVREDVERLRARLRPSNKVLARLLAMVEPLRIDPLEAGDGARKRLLYETGPQAYSDRLLLAAADSADSVEDIRPGLAEALGLPDRWTVPRLPVSGNLLLARGVPPGPAVGHALDEIERRWIEAGFPGGAAQMEAIVADVLGG